MTPCEEAILRTIKRLGRDNGEVFNIRLISNHAFVSERYTRHCLRHNGKLMLKEIEKFIVPGKPARIVLKQKENKDHDDDNCNQ